MQFLWLYIDDLVGKGLEVSVLLEFLFYASATFVPLAFPIAILLSSLMTFGNMGEHYELVAFKSSGISLVKIMRPMFVFTVFISLGSFLFANNILPVANLKFRTLLHDIRQQRPELNIRPGIFYKGIDNFVIKIASKDKETNMMYNIMVFDHTNSNDNRNVIIADSASMKMTMDESYLIITMYNGHKYEDLEEERKPNPNRTYPFQRSHFEKETILLDLSGFGLKRTDEDLFKENQEMLNIAQLLVTKDSLIKAFQDRKVEFASGLLKTHYYKRMPVVDSLKPKPDSNITFIIDTLINSLGKGKKLSILESAMNYARSAKSYINVTASDFAARQRFISKNEIEFHRKFSLSFACIVMFLIGAPLGAIIRKGGFGMPVVIATVMFIIFFVITIFGEKMSKQLIIPAYIGMWLSCMIFLPVGVFLTYKSNRDSKVFDFDAFISLVKNIFGVNIRRNLRLQWLYKHYYNNEIYSYDEIIEHFKNLKKIIKQYYQSNLKFGLSDVIKNTFSVPDKNLLDEIKSNYDKALIMVMFLASKNSYFKSKINELPLFTRIKFKSSIFYYILYPFIVCMFPLFIIHQFIVMGKLRRKFQSINENLTDMINVLENPELLQIKAGYENSSDIK
ncbi:MAG: LptF/LptG family permease [Marinilabiliales bacterium]